MKDDLFKILEEVKFKRKDNVISISKNDISPLTKSLVKEVFGRESILIDDKISDCYIIIENAKFSQVVLCSYIKFVMFFMICNFINCVYYGYNFAYLDNKIFYSIMFIINLVTFLYGFKIKKNGFYNVFIGGVSDE